MKVMATLPALLLLGCELPCAVSCEPGERCRGDGEAPSTAASKTPTPLNAADVVLDATSGNPADAGGGAADQG